jgi:CPA2 family monovalent cation:H+ antiporter-2
MTKVNPCAHMNQIVDVKPDSPDACPRCVELGDDWVHLRVCLVCGRVGCCDNSKNKHATRHFHESGHPVMQSYEPGEAWRWCYVDESFVPGGRPFRT